MAGGKRARGCEAPQEDQEWFIRENAVALVRERNAKIVKLRKRITTLEEMVTNLRRELAKANRALQSRTPEEKEDNL